MSTKVSTRFSWRGQLVFLFMAAAVVGVVCSGRRRGRTASERRWLRWRLAALRCADSQPRARSRGARSAQRTVSQPVTRICRPFSSVNSAAAGSRRYSCAAVLRTCLARRNRPRQRPRPGAGWTRPRGGSEERGRGRDGRGRRRRKARAKRHREACAAHPEPLRASSRSGRGLKDRGSAEAIARRLVGKASACVELAAAPRRSLLRASVPSRPGGCRETRRLLGKSSSSHSLLPASAPVGRPPRAQLSQVRSRGLRVDRVGCCSWRWPDRCSRRWALRCGRRGGSRWA
jgi:hypothetical protein